MSKIIFWVVAVIVIMIGLRLWNLAKTRTQKTNETKAKKNSPEAMVQCVRCGVFVPRSEAREHNDGFRCADHDDR